MRSKEVLFILFSLHLWCCSFAKLKLTLVHNNDVHVRFSPITEQSSLCRPEQQDTCIAGAARTTYQVSKIRSSEKHPVMFLSAGDFFQGSILYSEYKFKVVNDFVFKMGYDVITLGNHEFDDGVDGLVPFLQAAKNHSVPVVSTNLDISGEPKLKGLIEPSVVKQFKDTNSGKNVSVGFVGYVTPTTTYLSNPGKTVIFNDEISTLKKEVDKLKSKGIKIIIALGHSGYLKDLEVAKAIPDIDVIVGGHSNSFLWPGTYYAKAPPPSIEKPVGPYPTVVNHGDRKTLVVQAYAYGKYLGRLDVTFDEDGKIESFEGEPILMGRNIPQDRDVKQLADEYMIRIAPRFQVIGRTPVLLEGREIKCRMQECLLGNLIADAYVYAFIERPNEESWTRFPIALFSSGDIRSTIDVLSGDGDITYADIKNALPFENDLLPVNVTGADLYQIFENSVSTWDPKMRQLEGRFLQISGIKVVYDTSKRPGSRVVSLKARCGQCTSPEYSDVDGKSHYTIITTNFLRDGGDGYTLLATKPLVGQAPIVKNIDALTKYFRDTGLAVPEIQGRILNNSAFNRNTFSLLGLIYPLIVIAFRSLTSA